MSDKTIEKTETMDSIGVSDVQINSKMEYLKARVNREVKELSAFMGYVLYFYDEQNLVCDLLPLPKINPVLRMKRTKEVFELGNPAFYLDGKPVFIVLRGVAYSISFEFMDTKIQDKNKKRMIEKGYSASEIDAKLHSNYTNIIFRRKKVDIFSVTLIILTNIITALVCYMIFSTPVNTETNPIMDNLNSTISKTIRKTLFGV